MSVLSAIAALLLSVFLLIVGNALIAVATPLRARIDGFPDLTVGLLGSAYFAGLLLGSLTAPAMIRRAGPIRAFAAFAAVAVTATVLMPVFVSPAAWLWCRALLGFAFAGLYAVIEAWVNVKATNANRGRLYALYQLTSFAASAAGQGLVAPLGPAGFQPFAAAAALLALAIVPMALTLVDPPAPPRTVRPRLLWLMRAAPLACLAAFAAGAANGASISLAPVFALDIGMAADAVPAFTAAIVLGSAVGVFPIGALSDRVDRRLVMAGAMIAAAAFEIWLSRFSAASASVIALGFLIGMTSYSLYTLAVSTANDGAAAHDLVFISVGLLFVYCVAAVGATALASLMMKTFGPQALFVQNAFIHVAVAAIALGWALARPAPGRLVRAVVPSRPD